MSYELKKMKVNGIADALREASFLQNLKEWKRKRSGNESGDLSGESSAESDDISVQHLKAMSDDSRAGVGCDESSSAVRDGLRSPVIAIVSEGLEVNSESCNSTSQSSESESVSSGGSTCSSRRVRRRRNRPRRNASGIAMTVWNSDYHQRWRDRGDRYGSGQPNSPQSRRCDSGNEEHGEGCWGRGPNPSFRARHLIAVDSVQAR